MIGVRNNKVFRGKVFLILIVSFLFLGMMAGEVEARSGSREIFCDGANNPSGEPDLSNPRIYTALGCVPAKMGPFVTWLLPYVFGIAGGMAFLLMVGGFIQIAAAKGDPKAIQGGKETIGSAVTGLLVCIFAIFILRLIAIDILHIPGMK